MKWNMNQGLDSWFSWSGTPRSTGFFENLE